MSDESRAIWLRKTMAAFGLLLFAITWRLWTPQTEFPQIPFFRWLVNVPGAVDWIVASAMTVGLVAMLLGTQRWARGSLVLFLASTAVLVLLNQHRLQPWVYLLLVTGGLLVCLPNKTSLTWLRRIVISSWLVASVGATRLEPSTGRTHLERLVHRSVLAVVRVGSTGCKTKRASRRPTDEFSHRTSER